MDMEEVKGDCATSIQKQILGLLVQHKKWTAKVICGEVAIDEISVPDYLSECCKNGLAHMAHEREKEIIWGARCSLGFEVQICESLKVV
jgi:hypothetical protein